jgi:hypothetical protein
MTTNAGKDLLPEDKRRDECPRCAPEAFEPDWLTAKGAAPWEAYPDKYTKLTNQDGSITYRSTDEWRQDSEDKLRTSYERADKIEASKVEEKRRNRRTTPMTSDEIARATNKWRPYFEDRAEQGNRRWNAAIKELIQ